MGGRTPEEENKMKHVDGTNIAKRRLGWMFALPLALVLATHGLIHLMYVTWTGPGVELGYDGSSWIAGDATGIVTGLVALTILGNCLAALGLLRLPVLRDHVVALVMIGNVASLASFAVMFPGLVPDASAHVYGMITSIVLIAGAVYRLQLTKALERVLPGVLARRLGAEA
jgi:hypothetical protein